MKYTLQAVYFFTSTYIGNMQNDAIIPQDAGMTFGVLDQMPSSFQGLMCGSLAF